MEVYLYDENSKNKFIILKMIFNDMQNILDHLKQELQ